MDNKRRAKIFYGAGGHAAASMKRWINQGIIPACFADKDPKKHDTYIETSCAEKEYRFQVLPLSEAIRLYPNYEIHITVSPSFADKVRYELIKCYHMQPEQIFLQPQREGNQGSHHCEQIGEYFILDGPGISMCCEPPYSINYLSKGNIAEDIRWYTQFTDSLCDKLNKGEYTACTGCPSLEHGEAKEKKRIKRVNISTGLPGGDTCNFRCCYCTYGEDLSACERTDTVLDILHYIADNLELDTLSYASGEITVSPYREQIFELWNKKRWKGAIRSNAAIYSEGIAHLLKEKLITLNVSIDSGTPETFYKVKGANCFEKVIENLHKYSETGSNLELKYIMLPGINDNEKDIQGFLGIAEAIRAKVIITRDIRILATEMSESEYQAVKELIDGCKKKSLSYSCNLRENQVPQEKLS